MLLFLMYAAYLTIFCIVTDFKNDVKQFNEIAKSKHSPLDIRSKLNEFGIQYRNLMQLSVYFNFVFSVD